MPEATTIKGVSLDQPGNSLAAWLAVNHPDLFLAMFKQAQSAKLANNVKQAGLRGLADDFEPTLQQINVDTSSIMPGSFLTDATSSGSSWLDSVGSGLTSTGSTVGGVLSSVGSGLLSAVGNVGSFFTSSQGLNSLAGVAKSYFAAQAAGSTAVTQAAVLGAQMGRVQTGRAVAPITYSRDANGALVPVYATQTPQGAIYQPLSSQGIASLTPSGVSLFLSRYGIWIGVGVITLAVGYSMMARRR